MTRVPLQWFASMTISRWFRLGSRTRFLVGLGIFGRDGWLGSGMGNVIPGASGR